MKTATSLIAAAAVVIPLASAITLNEPRDAAPRVVGLDIQRQRSVNAARASNARFRKRASVTETLDNAQGEFYFANITLGTPAQKLRMTIDTGSSDLWTNVANSSLCESKNPSDQCQPSGTYDPSSSSTYKFVNSEFNISYADGSGAVGDYVSDTMSIGGQSLRNFEFGVGLTSSSGQGVLGIGYANNEAILQNQGAQTYNNLPLAMADAGLINTPAYSLWLNDIASNEGQILFGGVNTAKYHGELQSVPIIQEQGQYVEFVIALTGVSFTSSKGSTNKFSSSSLPAAILLDSGSTFSYLPNDIVAQLYKEIGAEYDPNQGVAYTSCNLQGALNFTFSSPNIGINVNEELLFEATDNNGNPLTFKNGEPVCILGVNPSEGSVNVLGDTFLRSAYVVYDLNNNEISLAPTDFNSTEDSIKEIASGTSGVPGATPVANAVTSVVAATGGAILGGGAGNGGTAIGSFPGSFATATAFGAAGPAFARPTGQAALNMGYMAAGAAMVAAAL